MAHHPDPPAKRRRTRDPVPPPPRHPDAAAIISEDLAAHMVNRANAQILQTAGFSGCTRVVQERLRWLAEDYMLNMMREIQRFAHAQRRTRPTVVDFQQMLLQKNISINDLDDEMRRVPLTPPIPLLPPPAISAEEMDFRENTTTVQDLLGAELDGGADKRQYIPGHLPAFPSKHTYLTTPVFTERPREPRVIREMATQEAMLAESALRKILAAAAGGNNKRKAPKDVEGEEKSKTGVAVAPSVLKKKRRDEIWENTFNAIKASEEAEAEAKQVNGVGEHFFAAGGEGGRMAGKGKEAVDANVWLEVIVNADSQYWRGGGGKALKGRQA
ncbi:transcription factor TFIID complex subunit 8 C-term-domain-containing protein [Tirmania nivea]|nr:transcription factor TFIID complex subunit 8 C-term-domain-containing protein [Tirmania nivea]